MIIMMMLMISLLLLLLIIGYFLAGCCYRRFCCRCSAMPQCAYTVKAAIRLSCRLLATSNNRNNNESANYQRNGHIAVSMAPPASLQHHHDHHQRDPDDCRAARANNVTGRTGGGQRTDARSQRRKYGQILLYTLNETKIEKPECMKILMSFDSVCILGDS